MELCLPHIFHSRQWPACFFGMDVWKSLLNFLIYPCSQGFGNFSVRGQMRSARLIINICSGKTEMYSWCLYLLLFLQICSHTFFSRTLWGVNASLITHKICLKVASVLPVNCLNGNLFFRSKQEQSKRLLMKKNRFTCLVLCSLSLVIKVFT